MKIKRTPVWDRDTYVYYFSNGDRSIVSVGKVTTYHNGNCSVAYDVSITKETIAFLHKLDDKEVRDNLKAINFEDYGMRKERLAKKKQWDIEHPNEENPYEKSPKVIRLNVFTQNPTLDMIDNYLYQHGEFEVNDDDSERIEILRKQIEKFITTLSPSMQELYKLLYVEELTQSEAKEILHLSRKAISKRNKRLLDKIFKEFSPKTATK